MMRDCIVRRDWSVLFIDLSIGLAEENFRVQRCFVRLAC